MQLTAKYGQTLIDMALQASGSVTALPQYLQANAIALDKRLTDAERINAAAVVNQSVVDYYDKNKIIPATGPDFNVSEYLELLNLMETKQELDHTITSGSRAFTGVKLDNLYKALTIQVNYTISEPVTLKVEQSLDGQNWSAVAGAEDVIHSTENTFTFNIVDLMTTYVRVIVEATGNAGVIESIIYKV